MTRVGTAALVLTAAVALQAASQSTSTALFEAISIKEGTGTRLAAHWEGARFLAAGQPLRTFLAVAYGVPFEDMANLPSWVQTTPWEINALASRPPAPAEQEAFLRAILEDRFRVIARVTTEERPIYTLSPVAPSVARTPGLKRSEIDCVGGPSALAALAPGQCNIALTASAYTRRGVPVDSLTAALRSLLRRPVVDRTGLTGLYDFDLHFRPLSGGATAPELDGLPDLQTAVQEQLGLKLESGRGPVEVTTFERVERPTPN